MPKFAKVLLAEIDEPQTPIRFAMDEAKMDTLCESMKELGLLQPIGLKRKDGRYEIEYGHRRFRAAIALKWKEIPALVFTAKELSEGAAMLAENIEREDITASEEAVLFAEAQETLHIDEAGLMKRFRKSGNYIAERLSLLRSDELVFKAVADRHISFAAAKELNKCTDEGHRRYLLDSAIRSNAGAKVIMGWVCQWKAFLPQPSTIAKLDTPPPPPAPAISHGIECCMCGGFRDPYNLVSVYIHKWELEKIREIMQQPPVEPELAAAVAAPESSQQ